MYCTLVNLFGMDCIFFIYPNSIIVRIHHLCRATTQTAVGSIISQRCTQAQVPSLINTHTNTHIHISYHNHNCEDMTQLHLWPTVKYTDKDGIYDRPRLS